MKQSTLMTPSSNRVNALRESPLREAYINGLPPRGRYLHGTSIDLFFERIDFSIAGEIIEDEQGFEGSALAFGATLGIEYWHDEIVVRRGMPVIEATELTSRWRSVSYNHLLLGPREVRLYTRTNSQSQESRVSDFLVGLELIAIKDTSQRILFLASAGGSPGDVEILTALDGYDAALERVTGGFRDSHQNE